MIDKKNYVLQIEFLYIWIVIMNWSVGKWDHWKVYLIIDACEKEKKYHFMFITTYMLFVG